MQREIAQLLAELRAGDGSAWEEFLRAYAGVVYQVATRCVKDKEDAADCFTYACERLHDNNFRRLRRFDPSGAASFPTWLRAVVRNLCLDWLRSRYGREATFASVSALSALEIQVYQALHLRQLSREGALHHLQAEYPQLTPETLEAAEAKVRAALTSKQNWLLAVRTARPAHDDAATAELVEEVADTTPNPEQRAAENEQLQKLAAALSKVAAEDRLLLRLRFVEELTLLQIAKLMGLPDAQTADRRIQAVLKTLRAEFHLEPRKISPAFRVKKANG